MTSLTYFAAQVAMITTLLMLASSAIISRPRSLSTALFALICLSTVAYQLTAMQYPSAATFR